MSKHTPGPWYTCESSTTGYGVTDTEGGCPIAECGSEADARLIACAPEMYAMLRKILLDVAWLYPSVQFGEKRSIEIKTLMRKIKGGE